MRVLLLSMPDTADVIDYVGRLSNLALVSLAGNLPGHDVKVLDLVLVKPRIRKPLERALDSLRPEVVGLSAMTFQFDTLLRVARFIRQKYPSIRIMAGGYHATLMAEEIAESAESLPIDFLIRGEGEQTCAELIAELEKPDPDLGAVRGLSYKGADGWRHNPPRPLLDLRDVRLPSRHARICGGAYYLGLPIDVVETSRGCPYNCKFCSITHMYGRTFRTYPEERIVEDLKNIRAAGTKAAFIVDDNITYDINHFRGVCQAITRHGLNDMTYAVQVTAAGLAKNPELVDDMDRANFRTAFVGFESMLPSDLKHMNKPTNPEINRRAAALLRQHDIAIIAGVIVGYPDDTRETVIRNFRLVRELKPDMFYAQYLTPYPKTVLRDEMLDAGLVVNVDDYRAYDGFTCNVRTRHLSRKELYRCLKKEAMKNNFSPSLIAANYFLKHYPLPLLKSVCRNMVTNLYNVAVARQWRPTFDI